MIIIKLVFYMIYKTNNYEIIIKNNNNSNSNVNKKNKKKKK